VSIISSAMREDEFIIVDFDEALQKTGAELFKELYRIYPLAEVEDYYKQGIWNNDLMKSDLRLIEAHRREAGAPDVKELEDIKFPALPTSAVPSAAIKLIEIAAAAAKARANSAPASTTLAPAGTAGNAASIDAKITALINLFAAKYKLDQAMCRSAFAKLNSDQRKHVIMNFKPSNNNIGIEAMKELVVFIQKAAKDNSWSVDLGSSKTDTKLEAKATSAAADASATKASSASPTAAAPLNPNMVAGGAKATAGMLPSCLINVPKIRPALTSVKPLNEVAKSSGVPALAFAQSLKRPLMANALNWNVNKRPALASASPRPNVPTAIGARPPAGVPGLLGNMFNNFK